MNIIDIIDAIAFNAFTAYSSSKRTADVLLQHTPTLRRRWPPNAMSKPSSQLLTFGKDLLLIKCVASRAATQHTATINRFILPARRTQNARSLNVGC